LVELVSDYELVIHGERDGLALRAVPKCRIESEDFHTLFGTGGRLLRYAYFFLLLEERHHLPQLTADGFDRLITRLFAHGKELVASGLVLLNPLTGELAGLNLLEDLLHLGAGLVGDDALAARIVAVLGRVRDRVAHVSQAAFLDEVDDQL